MLVRLPGLAFSGVVDVAKVGDLLAEGLVQLDLLGEGLEQLDLVPSCCLPAVVSSKGLGGRWWGRA